MALPYNIDSLLAKQNLFYNECNQVAQSIADEIIDYEDHNDEDDEIEEYALNGLREHVRDTMDAYADDLINSHGIAQAMRLYLTDCKKQGIDTYDEKQWGLSLSQYILLVIMEEPVVGRVKGLLLEYRRSLQASS